MWCWLIGMHVKEKPLQSNPFDRPQWQDARRLVITGGNIAPVQFYRYLLPKCQTAINTLVSKHHLTLNEAWLLLL